MATRTPKAAESVAKTKKTVPKKKVVKPHKAAACGDKPAAGAKKGNDALYTDHALRHRLKEEIQAGEKGGKAGQWSARKAQLLAAEYEKAGGAYRKAQRAENQQHIEKWTEQHWQTADGSKAIQGKTTSRYLPEKAWDQLTPAEKKATNEKKKKASRTGKQFVGNTVAAKRARKKAE